MLAHSHAQKEYCTLRVDREPELESGKQIDSEDPDPSDQSRVRERLSADRLGPSFIHRSRHLQTKEDIGTRQIPAASCHIKETIKKQEIFAVSQSFRMLIGYHICISMQTLENMSCSEMHDGGERTRSGQRQRFQMQLQDAVSESLRG
jgi:hypothetical protein